jgi:hypothetical protein
MMCFLRIVVAAAVVSAAFGDTVTLKNGQMVTGTYLGGTARQVRIDMGDQIQTFQVSEIARIEFGGPEPQAPPGIPQVPPPPPPQMSESAPPVLDVTLPAGTNFIIRMIDSVDSQTARIGQTFAASMDAPVKDPNGSVLIPKGAEVLVKLVDAKQSGKIAGRTELALSLMQVKVNGQWEDVNTQTVSQKSADRAGRSAETIGGGAVGGAILGGILGGGKGAAVGAAAGAAGGTAVELATSGQRVRVPSETRLTFVLDVPLRI